MPNEKVGNQNKKLGLGKSKLQHSALLTVTCL